MSGLAGLRISPVRLAGAALRGAGALVLLAVFATSAMGVWFFLALFLGLSLDENATEGGPSTLTSWEYALTYGAASLAAVAVVVPGLALAKRLARPDHVVSPPQPVLGVGGSARARPRPGLGRRRGAARVRGGVRRVGCGRGSGPNGDGG